MEVLKVVRICGVNNYPVIYLPKEAINRLSLKVGDKVVICFEEERHALIIKPAKNFLRQESKDHETGGRG